MAKETHDTVRVAMVCMTFLLVMGCFLGAIAYNGAENMRVRCFNAAVEGVRSVSK